jgi:hypothetical protein
MPIEPAIPKEIFRTQLPAGTSLIVLFVPSKDREGSLIDQPLWVNEVLMTLGKLFRGATAYPRGRGVWRDDERGGQLLEEEPVIVFCYADPSAVTKDSLTELYRTLSRMGRQANQGEIGVVIDGTYYGITEYSEE